MCFCRETEAPLGLFLPLCYTLYISIAVCSSQIQSPVANFFALTMAISSCFNLWCNSCASSIDKASFCFGHLCTDHWHKNVFLPPLRWNIQQYQLLLNYHTQAFNKASWLSPKTTFY